MNRWTVAVALWLLSAALPPVSGQILLTGRLDGPRAPDSAELVPYAGIYGFASLNGTDAQALGFRTWETHPAGWYRFSGAAGTYTTVFSSPAQFMRPIIMTNVHARDGEVIDRNLRPRADFAVLHEGAWDDRPAHGYYQPFVAWGTSLTHVGFKLAHDGVDGAGPGSQNLLISVHRKGDGPPDTWEQVGRNMIVRDVDCGGPKGYHYSAGWNSGEVPLQRGQTYAVYLRAEQSDGAFQTFWRPTPEGGDGCYRVAPSGEKAYAGHDLWMSIATDADGLVIPYNKRVHKEYTEMTRFARKWSQTYVARGRSLASVIVYGAASGVQPSMNRQRLAVRVRQDGPDGDLVGIEKIAIGNGHYTGDASWGVYGLAYAPGEVPLEPGRTYAIEFESIENHETLHGFVNIKGEVSDDRPGFNPYRKVEPDTYEHGRAYYNGSEPMDYDLDMQVIEYQFAHDDWANALRRRDLLANGDMESGTVGETPEDGRADAWKPFRIDPDTMLAYLADGPEQDNRILRVHGGGASGKTADGGFVQRVEGLSNLETYRLTGRVRSSYPVDVDRQCFVGYDPTGQDTDPEAPTIRWTLMPALTGIFLPYESDPIRPEGEAVSIWLRGRTTIGVDYPFKADFDDFALRRYHTGVPGPARTRRGPT